MYISLSHSWGHHCLSFAYHLYNLVLKKKPTKHQLLLETYGGACHVSRSIGQRCHRYKTRVFKATIIVFEMTFLQFIKSIVIEFDNGAEFCRVDLGSGITVSVAYKDLFL